MVYLHYPAVDSYVLVEGMYIGTGLCCSHLYNSAELLAVFHLDTHDSPKTHVQAVLQSHYAVL